IDEIDSERFIATEFIDGETLRDRLKSVPFSTHEAIDIGIQIASALCATHGVGIVHRDIKPDNIMLRRDGIIKILDFGLAKLARERQVFETDPDAPTQVQVKTEEGVVMGTAPYMSPEQARGFELDARTDIWSVGCVLYEMVTGRQPFAAPTKVDMMSGILSHDPNPLQSYVTDSPPEFERIILRALRKDREERYQTAKDFLIELKDLKSDLDNVTKRISTSYSSAERSVVAVPEKSIAVLYFENMNSD